jgi:23S rRNA pseudouridine1911/1915/1917 synthase
MDQPPAACCPANAPATGRWTVLAGPDHAGLRLDRFLTDEIGTLSRSRVKALIEDGHATADGAAGLDPADSVRPGVRYTILTPPPRPASPQAQAIGLTILHEDADLIVLDKPAGLVVHPAPGNEDGTLVNALLAHCGGDLPGIGGERRPGIVHRDLERSYLALCWGLPTPTAGTIEGAIGRDPRDRKRMALVSRGGKPALTHYRTLTAWGTAAALLECRLATGRTHQIRVHLSASGTPIVGDPVYLRRVPAAARGMPEPQRSRLLDFPRQALHAASLGFRHPVTGAPLRFTTAPPPDFAELMSSLDG